MTMVGLKGFITFWSVVLYVVASPNNNNGTTTTEHQLKEMQETISDLQKHMLAQEQKQTAVLSSVLSQLTETKDELASLQFNYTVLENELSSLKNNVVDGAAKSTIGQEVAFEASIARTDENPKHIIFNGNEVLIFQTVIYNKGGCWNSSNGVFTATVNGTYMLWINLSFTQVKDVTLSMKRNDDNVGQTHGRQPHLYSTHTISLTSITPLVEEDRVYFVVDSSVTFQPADFSSLCGGVLLHSDIQ